MHLTCYRYSRHAHRISMCRIETNVHMHRLFNEKEWILSGTFIYINFFSSTKFWRMKTKLLYRSISLKISARWFAFFFPNFFSKFFFPNSKRRINPAGAIDHAISHPVVRWTPSDRSRGRQVRAIRYESPRPILTVPGGGRRCQLIPNFPATCYATYATAFRASSRECTTPERAESAQ